MTTPHRPDAAAFRVVGGDVLSNDPSLGLLRAHDVYVAADGTVAHLAPTTGLVEAGDIDARGMWVAPGFVDVHRHLWVTPFRGATADQTAQGYRQFTKSAIAPHVEPDDVYAATLLGALEALDAGITTVVDYAHIMKAPEYADAAVAALRRSGVRAVLAHAPPNGDDNAAWWSASELRHPDDIGRVHAELANGDGMVTVMMGARGVHFLAPGTIERDVDFAREIGLRVMFEGIGAAVGESGRWLRESHRTAAALDRTGRLGADLVFVHGNQLPDDELRLIARSGGHLAVAPLTEMLCGYGMPVLDRARREGINVGLAVDIVTNVGGDMFGAMRTALATVRGERATAAYRSGVELGDWDLLAEDVLAMATTGGAALLGTDATGVLAPGKAADMIVVRTDDLNLTGVSDPATALALFAHPGNIDTVVVGGRVVKLGGRMVGSHVAEARELARQTRQLLLTRAGADARLPADEIWQF